MNQAVNRGMRRNPELMYRGRTVGDIIDDVPLAPRDAVAPALPLVAFVTRQQRRLEARRRAKEAAGLDKAYRHGGAA